MSAISLGHIPRRLGIVDKKKPGVEPGYGVYKGVDTKGIYLE